MVANNVSHAVGEKLRPAARERIDTGVLQLLQSLLNGKLSALGQISHLYHGEGLQMDLRKTPLQAGNQIEKILKRKIGMQAAHNVKLCDRFAVTRCRGFERFIKRHGVCARRVFLFPEGTEPAGSYADIGGIQMAIDVEVGLVTVQALTHGVCHPADSENITGAVEGEGIVVAQTLVGEDLLMNRPQAWIVSLEGMKLEHLVDDTAHAL